MNNNPTQYKCICDKFLIQVGDQSSTYKEGAHLPNLRVQCDICHHVIPNGTMFWHCEEEGNLHHPHGFDICDICIQTQMMISPQKSLKASHNRWKNTHEKRSKVTNPHNTITSRKADNAKKSIIELPSEVAELLILVLSILHKHKILIQEETLSRTTPNKSANKSRWRRTEQSEQKQMEIKHKIKHGHFPSHGTIEKQSENNITKHGQEFNPWATKAIAGVSGATSSAINKLTGVECTASDCDHFSRVVDTLKCYHQFIECNVPSPVSTNASIDINSILSCVSHVTLINDFHHLIHKHRANFERIYCTLLKACNNGKACDIKLCVPLRRNHRNRHRLRSNTIEINKLYFNHDNVKDISLQQILDKIHCYYFHTFDIGYKHRERDRNTILQRAQKHEFQTDDDDYVVVNGVIGELSRDIRSRKRLYENIDGLEDVGKNSPKFSSVAGDSYGIGLQFKFGVRFFYWPYYKDNVAMIDS
eukprot:185700_1